MTGCELVRVYFGKRLSAFNASHVLWEMTAFPCCDLDTLKKQLRSLQLSRCSKKRWSFTKWAKWKTERLMAEEES